MRSQHPKFVMWDAAHEKSCNVEQCSSKWRGTVLSKSRQFDLATLTNTTDLQTVSFSRTVHSVFPNSPLFFQYFNSGTEWNEGTHNESTTNTLKADFNLNFHVTSSKLKDHCLTPDSHIFQSSFLFPLCICLPDVFYAPSDYFI